MRRIRVAIGTTRSTMFREVLEQLLKSIPGIDVQVATSAEELESVLGEQLHVLILEAPSTEPEPDFGRYFDTCPGLSIIAFDPAGAETIIRLRDVGRDLLLQLIETLSRHAIEDRASPRLRVVGSADIERLATEQTPADDLSRSGYFSTREHIEDICKWLDLILHHQLALDTPDDNGVSVPGWAMSAVRARQIIGGAGVDAEAEALAKAARAVEELTLQRESASVQKSGLSRLATLFDAFGLSRTERRVLLLSLAPELDDRYARVFGYLNDDLTRRRPTPTRVAELALGDEALAWDVRRHLTGEGMLASYQLVSAVDSAETMPGSDVGLAPAKEVLAYILADDDEATAQELGIRLLTANPSPAGSSSLQQEITTWIRSASEAWRDGPIVQLVGDTAALRWFERAVTAAGYAMVELDLSGIQHFESGQAIERAYGAARMARLHDAVVVLTGLPEIQAGDGRRLEADVIAMLRARTPLLAVHGAAPWLMATDAAVWPLDRPTPGVGDRTAIWQERAQEFGMSMSKEEARAIASAVRFDEPEIDATLRLCRDQNLGIDSVRSAARRVSRTSVPSAVRRLEPVFGWDDIVLPDQLLKQLHQIPVHVQYSGDVLEDWGYAGRLPYGHGVAALFCGVSGTGKTMAAQIIARELGVEVFQVDLAKTISKYIGETEKNLAKVFDAAERASAVLLFDEADALFGKRTEVKDAHDRYANVEVAYLLQRMETYGGLAILTTNFRKNIDSAFLRRLRFVVDFPAPNAELREKIWQKVFPQDAPCSSDVDIKFLARRMSLTGGHIQQIAVRAAFAAVEDGGPIAMNHVVQATRDELIKLGMLNADKTLATVQERLAAGEQQ